MAQYLPDTPGPIYDLSSTSFVKQNQSKNKGFSLTGRPHGVQSESLPGPAKYNIKRDFDNKSSNTPQYSFTGKARDPNYDQGLPGPAAYYKDGPPSVFKTQGKVRGYTLSGRTRLPSMSDDDIPGPARYTSKYDPSVQSPSCISAAGTSSFLTSRRNVGAGSEGPGPKYNIPTTVGGNKINGRAASLGSRNHQPRSDDGPGPAKYFPTLPGESDASKKTRGFTMGAPLNPGASTYLSSKMARTIMLKDQVAANNPKQ